MADGTPGGPDAPSEGCTGCPLCRARSLLRHLPPDTRQHLAAAAAELRSALTAATAPRPDDSDDERTDHVIVQHVPSQD